MDKNIKIIIIIIGVILLCTFLIVFGGSAVYFLNSSKQITPNNASCEYNGTTLANGASFKDSDNCNTCSCENGQVACTMMFCN